MRPARREGGYHEGSVVHRSSSCFVVSDQPLPHLICLLTGSSGVNSPIQEDPSTVDSSARRAESQRLGIPSDAGTREGT